MNKEGEWKMSVIELCDVRYVYQSQYQRVEALRGISYEVPCAVFSDPPRNDILSDVPVSGMDRGTKGMIRFHEGTEI